MHFFFEKLSSIKAQDIVVIEGIYDFDNIAILLVLWEKKAITLPCENFELLKLNIHYDFLINVNRELLKNHKIKESALNKSLLKGNPGCLFLTSGTSGVPKIVLHDISKLYSHLQSSRVNNSFLFLKFGHFGGLFTFLKMLKSNGVVTVVDNYNPKYIFSLIDKYSIQLLPVTPTFLSLANALGVLNIKEYPSLKYISYGTEAIAEKLLKEISRKMPEVKFIQTYGLTEVGVLKTRSTSSESSFFEFEGEEFKTRISKNETLEIKMENSSVVQIIEKGINQPLNEWLDTQDLVEIGESGLRIISRKSSIINIAGEKIYPEEVENILLGFKDVAEVKVYGQKNDLVGHLLCADIFFVDIELSEKERIKQAIKNYCALYLPSHKIPAKINIEILNYQDTYNLKKERF